MWIYDCLCNTYANNSPTTVVSCLQLAENFDELRCGDIIIFNTIAIISVVVCNMAVVILLITIIFIA